MTREEAIKQLSDAEHCLAGHGDLWDVDMEAFDMAIKALKQNSILDKIRADIENMRIVYDRSPDYEDDRTDEEKAVDWFNMDKLLFLQIIDKYKAESNG
jgi:hypothetical protein